MKYDDVNAMTVKLGNFVKEQKDEIKAVMS